jgi:hypothetical protein
LDDAGTHDPDLRGRTGLLTEVETEEEEAGGRGDGIEPGGDAGDRDSGSSEDSV